MTVSPCLDMATLSIGAYLCGPPTGHVYAKMALNLIEKVANPASKAETRKRKRSEDTGSGSGSQHGSAPQPPRSHSQSHSGFPRDRFRDPAFNRNQGGSQYGTNPMGSRRYPPATHPQEAPPASVDQMKETEEAGTFAGSAAGSGTEVCPGGGPGRGGNLCNGSNQDPTSLQIFLHAN
jgi:hypothetical protein